MSKEMTEKGKNGLLPRGYYYVRRQEGIAIEYNSRYLGFKNIITNRPEALEILMKVPTFDEYVKLLQRVKMLEVMVQGKLR